MIWLKELINATEESAFKVAIDCKIEKDSLKRANGLTLTGKTDIYHFSDYESDEKYHARDFTEAMDVLWLCCKSK